MRSLIAERAADFVNATENHIEFAPINPVAILGPSLNQHMSLSFQYCRKYGTFKYDNVKQMVIALTN